MTTEDRLDALEKVVFGHGSVSGIVHRGEIIGQLDHSKETLTIHGCTFSLEVFRVLADPKEVGKWFKLLSNDGGCICIERAQ